MTFVRWPTTTRPGPRWRRSRRSTALLTEVGTRFTDFSELDDRFHRLVQSAASNRFFENFYDVILLMFHYHYQWNKKDQMERNRIAIEEHLALIGGLRSKSAIDAEYFCRKHLESAKRTLLSSIERSGTGQR
ncbi:FCD domain-containing protein [Prosthecomicrobium sp. N25]|uniref:FCD domain-containing protein n=1 Tax=Prosthecomicrobium sp. N25 TaxID=3129254 RepID=UPI003077579F